MQETITPVTPAELTDVNDSWNKERHPDVLRAFVARRLGDASLVDIELDV